MQYKYLTYNKRQITRILEISISQEKQVEVKFALKRTLRISGGGEI
jgi:hypothetical protein